MYLGLEAMFNLFSELQTGNLILPFRCLDFAVLVVFCNICSVSSVLKYFAVFVVFCNICSVSSVLKYFAVFVVFCNICSVSADQGQHRIGRPWSLDPPGPLSINPPSSSRSLSSPSSTSFVFFCQGGVPS